MLMNLKDVLAVANEHGFAVPAFNTSSNMILTGVIEACEEKKAPVIIAIHPDELHFVKKSFVKAVIEEAYQAKIPVCIHLDHGASFEQVMEAIQCGFTSVMIDASSRPFEENVAICKKVCEAAHAVNVSVEGELGTIGVADSQGGWTYGAPADQIIYTDPDNAADFIAKTGVDALAIAIGTSHGIYPKDMEPKLRIDLLKMIKEKVKIPLVLHGGSANHDNEMAEAAEYGINKINISSDIKNPFYQKCREVLQDKGIREPNQIYPSCIEVLKEAVCHKIDLFRASDKAKLYR